MNLGISPDEKCKKCKNIVQNCGCLLPNFLPEVIDGVNQEYISLYKSIAAADLENSTQLTKDLKMKANSDFRRIMRYLKPNRERLRVLEIGPGQGDLAKLFLESKHNYICTDLIPNYLISIESESFLSDVQSLPKFEKKFDLVIVIDVLEHVLNEADALLSVKESLSTNGLAYIRTPYREPLIGYATRLGAPYPFVHVRNYDKRSFRNAIQSVGLSIIHLGTANTQYSSATRRALSLKSKYIEHASRISPPCQPTKMNIFQVRLKFETSVILFLEKYKQKTLLKFFYRVTNYPSEIYAICKL